MAISGSQAIVGAYSQDLPGHEFAGASYLYVRRQGARVLAAKLTASDAGRQDLFGSSVAIDGRTAVVGARQVRNASIERPGAAYIFHDTSPAGDWSSYTETKLQPADSADGDQFGRAVAVSGRTVVVGAPDATHGGLFRAGAAYVFLDQSPEHDWSDLKEVRLTADDAAKRDLFGWSVAIEAGTVAVGAPQFEPSSEKSGAVYVYQDESGDGDWSSFDGVRVENFSLGERQADQ